MQATASSSLLCKQCLKGNYQNEIGSSNCKGCKTGTWSDKKGVTHELECQHCNAGKYSPAEGAKSQASCIECPPGKWSNTTGAKVSSDCQDCDIDFFSVDEGRNTTCEQCPSDATTKELAQTICLKCDAGEHMEILVSDGSKSCRTW